MSKKRKISIELEADIWLQFLCAMEGDRLSWEAIRSVIPTAQNKDTEAILDFVTEQVQEQLVRQLTPEEVKQITS